MLAAALEYAARGWLVFPCLVGSKFPATEHGFKDATTDTATIRKWWEANPNLNVAVATGRESGFFVVDIDPANSGDVEWHMLTAQNGDPPTYRVRTPSGGTHYYFRMPPSSDVRNRAGVRKGIDVRGTGGYVLTPPSLVDGKPYEVIP